MKRSRRVRGSYTIELTLVMTVVLPCILFMVKKTVDLYGEADMFAKTCIEETNAERTNWDLLRVERIAEHALKNMGNEE